MDNTSGIRKYYVGFGVLMLLLVGCLVYVFSQAGSAKADKATNKTVEQIANKLETNIAGQNSIPDSLEAAGIKNVAPTVKYTKLSSTQYKVCVTYNTATSGFDAGWGSLLLGGAFSSSQSTDQNNDRTYFDSSVEFNHKKGPNCQTVTPYGVSGYSNPYGYGLLNNQTNTSAKVSCSDTGSAVFVGYLTVQSVNPALNSITFTSGDTTTAPSSTSAGKTTTKVYDSKTVFCDSNAQPTSASSLKAGDYVMVYAVSNSNSTLALVSVIE